MNSKPMSSRATVALLQQRRAARRRCSRYCLRLLPAHLAHDAVRERQLGMRAGADAEVVAEPPVVEVVPALASRPRERRRLVVPVARGRERAVDRVLDVGRAIVVGQRRRMPVEERVRLDRQVIERQVRRRERRAPPRRRRARPPSVCPGSAYMRSRLTLPKIVERRLGRAPRLAVVVHAPERRADARGSKLWTPSDSRLTPAAWKPANFARSKVPGIGLERDFRVGRERHARANAGEQAIDRLAARTGSACRRR